MGTCGSGQKHLIQFWLAEMQGDVVIKQTSEMATRSNIVRLPQQRMMKPKPFPVFSEWSVARWFTENENWSIDLPTNHRLHLELGKRQLQTTN